MKTPSLAIASLGLLVAITGHAEVPTNLLGDTAPVGDATRTITIAPTTRYVNVTHGDVVRFVVNGQDFAVRFDGADAASAFDLRRLAPAGLLDHAVTAFVAPDSSDFGR